MNGEEIKDLIYRLDGREWRETTGVNAGAVRKWHSAAIASIKDGTRVRSEKQEGGMAVAWPAFLRILASRQ